VAAGASGDVLRDQCGMQCCRARERRSTREPVRVGFPT
jgi:hypothetical protein